MVAPVRLCRSALGWHEPQARSCSDPGQASLSSTAPGASEPRGTCVLLPQSLWCFNSGQSSWIKRRVLNYCYCNLPSGIFGPNPYGWCFSLMARKGSARQWVGWSGLLSCGDQGMRVLVLSEAGLWQEKPLPSALGHTQAGADLGLGCGMLHAGYSARPSLHLKPHTSPSCQSV